MKWIFPVFCASIFFSCSESGTSSSAAPYFFIQEDTKYDGMMLVNPKDSTVKLSSKLTADFNYNFSIGKHEITCSEYSKFIKKNNCEKPEYPVTNITFFDAILFANEKSKSENLDTAYSYTSLAFDSEGHCTGMLGYEFHADRDAYRLPTEAEWTLIATQSWDPSTAWTANNSGYALHEPCTTDTLNDFCDFAGNAMEWVNDWMGNLRDTSVTNYVGAPDGGNIGERVIKGGSYRNEVSKISLDNRGDIYTVTSSTKAAYIGFRIAFGKIPNAVWMSDKGDVTSQPINILSTSAQLKASTNTHLNKLVFRNEETGNIAFINFANGKPIVKEIGDSIDAYHPTLSPDGKYVAFSTKFEGISGTSEVYVRSLDSTSAKNIKLDVKSAAIPRWRVVDGDTEIVYVTTADINTDEANWKKHRHGASRLPKGNSEHPRNFSTGHSTEASVLTASSQSRVQDSSVQM